MFNKVFSRRALVVAGLAIGLAGCKVIPTAGPDTVAQPTPTPEPSASSLPTDLTRHRIVLLVPLSGRNGGVGESVANATTMALLDTNADNLRITTYDTAAGPADAAARAIADGNTLILGPLLGEDVSPVLSKARPAGVPLITFSNDTSVAASDVFVMGHIPEQSIARTVGYARSKGAKTFAALVPGGEYGERAEAALRQAVADSGGTLVAVERFDRGNTSAISAAERLHKRGGFDAVLIADGARISAMASDSLKSRDAVLPTIIGTELWSGEASIASEDALRGALFLAVPDNRYKRFSDAYRTRFGVAPYRIATLGYDSVLLTLRIAQDWQPGKPFPLSRMYDAGGFIGLDGPFRFLSNGVGERAMEVRQIGGGAVSVVSAAPARFQD